VFIILQEHIQSCSFSPEGDVIIVGTKSGKWFVFDTMTRELLAQYVDGAEPIQTIQFSPDGSVLAIGSRDNNIYLYQPSKDFRRFARSGKCAGHSSFILHLDFSMDGSIIRSNSGDYEVLYCEWPSINFYCR
jgi:echinoderm microtubule-associated protein-like 1/2